MKKVLFLLVALMLMLTAGAQAVTLELAYEGVIFTLPEDFVSTFQEDGDTVSIHMYTSEGLNNALFIIGVSALDTHPAANVEEDLMAIYEEIAGDLYEAAYEIRVIGDFTFLVITEGTAAEIIYLTQAYGNLIQITCIASGEAGLTEAQAEAALAIVTVMQVAPAPAE